MNWKIATKWQQRNGKSIKTTNGKNAFCWTHVPSLQWKFNAFSLDKWETNWKLLFMRLMLPKDHSITIESSCERGKSQFTPHWFHFERLSLSLSLRVWVSFALRVSVSRYDRRAIAVCLASATLIATVTKEHFMNKSVNLTIRIDFLLRSLSPFPPSFLLFPLSMPCK